MLRIPGLVALAVVVAVTLFSGADYFLRFWKDVRTGGGLGGAPEEMQGGGAGGAPKEPPQVV